MENNVQQAAIDIKDPALIYVIGESTNPQYFDFFQLTFSQQVGVTAAVIGTVWGVINISKFCYQAFNAIRKYLKPAKNPAL